MSPAKIVALVASEKVRRQHPPIFDIDRLGLDVSDAPPAVRSGGQHADIAGDIGDGDRLAARRGFHLLEVENRGERMAALPDQRAAAGHRPLGGVGRMGAAVALLGLHEQDLVLGRPQDFRRLGDGRRIDPVLGVHEQPAAGANRAPWSPPSPP